MKRFLAMYIGTATALEKAQWNELPAEERQKREHAGFEAWMKWGTVHAKAIVDPGSPLGTTKRAAPEGMRDIKNTLVGYVIVEAQSHEAAAKLFAEHPHFTVFPGDSVEIMECLPVPNK